MDILKIIQECYGGDVSLMLKVTLSFLDNADAQWLFFESSSATLDVRSLERAAHAIVSSLSLFHADELSDLFRAVEKEARKGNSSCMKEPLATYQQQFSNFCANLRFNIVPQLEQLERKGKQAA